MQAIARLSDPRRRRVSALLATLSPLVFSGPSVAMDVDFTERIHDAGLETGCSVQKIGKGKKRSGRMVYPVTCEENGVTIERKVACKLNACVFTDRDPETVR